eukprot:627646-Pyramimonas_sp.AAC.1
MPCPIGPLRRPRIFRFASAPAHSPASSSASALSSLPPPCALLHLAFAMLSTPLAGRAFIEHAYTPTALAYGYSGVPHKCSAMEHVIQLELPEGISERRRCCR